MPGGLPHHVKIINAVKWAAIGTNVIIFAKWRYILPPRDLPIEVKRDRTHPAMVAHAAHARAHVHHMVEHYTISRHNIAEGRYSTLITSAFSHVSIASLVINSFMLHQATNMGIFVGLGPLRLGALALASAVGSSVGTLTGGNTPSLGMHGVVQGMLVATACAAPYLPVNAFFVPFPFAYRSLVAAFLAFDLYGFYEERTAGGLKKEEDWSSALGAYEGRLGGAEVGVMFYLLAMRRGRVPQRLNHYKR